MGKVAPRVSPGKTKAKIEAILKAMGQDLILACHDLAEGGLAVALSEMLFAGGFGANISVKGLPGEAKRTDFKLFSESNGRWLVEISKNSEISEKFENIMKEFNVVYKKLGETTSEPKLVIDEAINLELEKLRKAWKQPIYNIVGGE
jgi:phosphoribosylformylglycinamidine synthase